MPPGRARAAIELALEWERTGVSQAPIRTRLEAGGALFLSMPASVPGYFSVKILVLRRAGEDHGLQTTRGVLQIFDASDGALCGTLDGAAVTAVRTAAIAGWATERLAAPDASRLLVIGAGAQAAPQVEAALSVRPIRQVQIWNRTASRAHGLADALSQRHPSIEISVASSLSRAAGTAQIITLVTSSRDPLLQLSDLEGGCHINAMGAHEATARELASDIVAGSDIYADTLAGCLAEAGDILIPIAEGILDPSRVRPLAQTDMRRSELTVMKSVGSAIFDAAFGVVALGLVGLDGVNDVRTLT
jgi:ornithine cyclodeaminase